MNRLSGFVSLDSFYIRIRGYFQTHFVLEKAKPILWQTIYIIIDRTMPHGKTPYFVTHGLLLLVLVCFQSSLTLLVSFNFYYHYRACPTNGSDCGSLRDHNLTLFVMYFDIYKHPIHLKLHLKFHHLLFQ